MATITAPARAAAPVVLPLLATMAAMACFQVGAAFAKSMFPAVGPIGAAALRLGLGAAILVVVVRPWRTWPRPAPVLALLGLGVATAGAVVMFYLAQSRLPLAVAISLQFLGPLAVAVVGSRRPTDLIWAALAAAGVWLLVGVGAGRHAGAVDPLGIVFALCAAVGWATYILCGRIAGAAFKGGTSALASTIAALVVLPIGLAQAGPAMFAPALLPIALLVALLSTVVPFSLELYAMPRLPARTFATFTSLEPAFGVLSGLFLLGQHLAVSQIAGVAAVIVAAAGAAWSSAATAPSPAITEAPLD